MELAVNKLLTYCYFPFNANAGRLYKALKKTLFFNNKIIITEISLIGMLYLANNMACKTASFPFLSGLIFISQITINAQQRKDMK